LSSVIVFFFIYFNKKPPKKSLEKVLHLQENRNLNNEKIIPVLTISNEKKIEELESTINQLTDDNQLLRYKVIELQKKIFLQNEVLRVNYNALRSAADGLKVTVIEINKLKEVFYEVFELCRSSAHIIKTEVKKLVPSYTQEIEKELTETKKMLKRKDEQILNLQSEINISNSRFAVLL